MAKFIILIFALLLIQSPVVYCENIKSKQLSKQWGQFTSNAEDYRAKADLINLTIKSSGEFNTFISTCTGTTEQAGKWALKDKKITFTVSKNTGVPFFKVLTNKEILSITYNITSLLEDFHSGGDPLISLCWAYQAV